jgi:mannan endo-1,4-beta-mannosidase
MDFCRVAGGRLWAGDAPLRFMGTNCYFLQEEGAREALGWEGYAGRVDEALRKAATLELGVVRAWAFNDDPENPAAIQTAPLRYGEAGLRGVDTALATAARHGVRLVLCLGNYWPDYGGARQYLAWHGLDPARLDLFFTHPAVVAHYGDHVEGLLRRRNPLTGLAWGDDPVVLAWELLNEPRGDGLRDHGEALAAWVQAIAARVRAAAPRQLVATGEEGHEGAGQDFGADTAAVDLASIHLYPESWRWPLEDVGEAGARWITGKADAAARLGRPLLVGELGLRNDGALPLVERRRAYDAWVSAAIAHPGVAGACSWSFSTDDRPDGWDPYTWTLRDGTDEAAVENRYADLHRRWARHFREAAP